MEAKKHGGYWFLMATLCNAAPLAFAQNGAQPPVQPDEVVTLGRREASEPTERAKKLVKVPGTFGDPLAAVATLPGVVLATEGSGEPAVRGGSPADNSYLIDGLPAGYVFHDLGNSIFHEDVIRDFGFAPAGFGARYGEASGALFDVALRTPRNAPPATTVDVSMLRAGVLVESRLSDKQAFYAGYRESLVHWLIEAASDEIKREDDILFERAPRARDLQAKYLWQPNERQSVTLLALGAEDEAALTVGARADEALLDPGSQGRATTSRRFGSSGLNWVYRPGRLVLTTRLGWLAQSERQRIGNGNEFLDVDLDQITAKTQLELPAVGVHRLAVGAERRDRTYDYAVRLRYRSCTAFSPDCDSKRGEITESARTQDIGFVEAFVEDRLKPTANFDLTLGARFSRDDYLRADFAEPRLSAAWRYRPGWELSAAWGRYHQLPEIAQIVPEFGNPNLRPFEAEHVVLGVRRELTNGWSVATEVYRKELEHVVVETAAPTQYVNAATGTAQGVELMIEREERGRWWGWATLSLARTERRNGLTARTTRFDTDTPVLANLVLNYALGPVWTAGLRWQYRSGLPYTPIVGNEPNPDFPGFYRPIYGDLNSVRADSYHRLDVRLERPLAFARGDGTLYVDVLNVYGRRNTGAAVYEPVAGSSDYRVVDEDGLPLLPSVGIKLRF